MAPSSQKILVVEDEPAALEAVSAILQGHGYEVITSLDGPTAVELILSRKPNLVVLDLNLPSPSPLQCAVFDGFSVLNWLRRLGPDHQIPTIVVTAVGAAAGKRKALEAGACAYLEKPVDCEKLLLAIRIALDSSIPEP
jgi:CheY-like chemotaxis protein